MTGRLNSCRKIPEDKIEGNSLLVTISALVDVTDLFWQYRQDTLACNTVNGFTSP